MYKNVGQSDRMLRMIIALSLFGYTLVEPPSLFFEAAFQFFACYLLYTSFMGQCVFYLVFLISTRKNSSRVKVKECSNDDLTVFWNEKKCMNSTMCVNKSLLEATKYQKVFEFFHPQNRPWIKTFGNLNTYEIIDAIENCTSGALSYRLKADANEYRKSA